MPVSHALVLLWFAFFSRQLRIPEDRLQYPYWQLYAAYQQSIDEVDDLPEGVLFRFRNGQTEWFRPESTLPLEARLDQADLGSVLLHPYPFGKTRLPVKEPLEPGRFRNYTLLKLTYGATPREVKRNLESVDFLGTKVKFNRNNGAAEALRNVAHELAQDPACAAYVKSGFPSSFYWRNIFRTRRLSAHSFGIALDILMPRSKRPQYWLWAGLDSNQLRQNREIDAVPQKLIDSFERHGFIWGGKWHHFDTIHFEYRPEFFIAQRSQLARPTVWQKASNLCSRSLNSSLRRLTVAFPYPRSRPDRVRRR